MWANKEAPFTFTDDDSYFVHRGKLDIFNFSKQPGGNDTNLLQSFVLSNLLKKQLMKLIDNGKFVPLKCSNPSAFAYAIVYKGQSLVVIGNLDFRSNIETDVFIKKFKEDNILIPITAESISIAQKGKLYAPLNAGEVQVFILNDLEVR